MRSLASPASRDIDIHSRLAPAPASADRQRLRDDGVPAALRVLIEGVWDRRPVVLFGDELTAAPALWKLLSGVRSKQDWMDWLAFARKSAWGKPDPWSRQVESWSLSEQRQAWKSARNLLGAPLAEWLQEDEGWSSWYSAAQSRLGEGEDRLERRTRDLDQKRRNARPNPKAPFPDPDECSLPAIKEKAEAIANRFGLVRLEAAAGMPLWCVAEHLALAQDGLAELASALAWPEARVGSSHLGLGWELGPKDMSGGYDPLRHMIYLGREDWHGSFAHEFGHALDRVGADAKTPGIFLSTQIANDVLQDSPALTNTQIVYARQEMIRGFHSIYKEWRKEYPRSHDQLDALDNSLDQWVGEVLDPARWQPNLRKQWDRWRARMTLVLTNANKPWVERFERLCSLAETLWDDPPATEGWQAWAQARDNADARRYWAQPHEMWARAFHAIVAKKMSAPNWAACDAGRADLYPCRQELERWVLKWEGLRPHLEARWIEHGANALQPQAPRASN